MTWVCHLGKVSVFLSEKFASLTQKKGTTVHFNCEVAMQILVLVVIIISCAVLILNKMFFELEGKVHETFQE